MITGKLLGHTQVQGKSDQVVDCGMGVFPKAYRYADGPLTPGTAAIDAWAGCCSPTEQSPDRQHKPLFLYAAARCCSLVIRLTDLRSSVAPHCLFFVNPR